MSNKALNKKIYIICGGIIAILLVFVVGVAIIRLNYEKKLLSNGIRTEAQVINKYHVKNIKGKIKKSYIELAIFEDTAAIVKQQKIEKTPTNIDEKLDNLFENFGSKKMPVGDYKTKTILVDLAQYNDFVIGSSRTFVYLKGDLENGMLLSKLE